MKSLTVTISGPQECENCAEVLKENPGSDLEKCDPSYTVSYAPNPPVPNDDSFDGVDELGREATLIDVDCSIHHESGWTETAMLTLDYDEGELTWSVKSDWTWEGVGEDVDFGEPTCPQPETSSFTVTCHDTNGNLLQGSKITTGAVISFTATSDFSAGTMLGDDGSYCCPYCEDEDDDCDDDNCNERLKIKSLTMTVAGPKECAECAEILRDSPEACIEKCDPYYTVSYASDPKQSDDSDDIELRREDDAVEVDCVIHHESGWTEAVTVVISYDKGALTWSSKPDWTWRMVGRNDFSQPTFPHPATAFTVTCCDTNGKPVQQGLKITTGVVISITATSDFSVGMELGVDEYGCPNCRPCPNCCPRCNGAADSN